MNNNKIELIRDAMAGAILGALICLGIFLITVIIGLFEMAAGDTFEVMKGSTFVILTIFFMFVGGAIGYAMGFYATQNETMHKRIKKWMNKNNQE